MMGKTACKRERGEREREQHSEQAAHGGFFLLMGDSANRGDPKNRGDAFNDGFGDVATKYS